MVGWTGYVEFSGMLDELAFYDLSGEADVTAAGAALAAHLDMDGPAYVVKDPTSVVADPGNTVTFYCQAAGAEPIAYQWKKNGVALSDGAGVSGTNTGVLKLSGVDPTSGGTDLYSCQVSNGEGGEESAPAGLTVNCWYDVVGDYNNDCLVDMADLEAFAQMWLENSAVTP